MHDEKRMKMNLQFFAEPGDPNPPADPPANPPVNPPANPAPPTIDYEKIQQMLNGTLAAKENTALKKYFEQQGLNQQEAEQAIAAYKEQKAKNQPNVEQLQQQATTAQQQAQNALIERDAYKLSGELGIDLNTMQYVLKMADMSAVVGSDGKIDQEKLKEALNKVLEDVPQLKPQTEVQQNGFRQIGVGNQTQVANNQQSTPAVPTKRWNRWN